MGDELRFSIPGKPEYIQMVRLAISSVAGKAAFDMEAVEDLELAVSEACTNISCHGRDGFSKSYEVVASIFEKSISISVKDTGHGEETIKAQRPCKCCPQEGDLALIVIKTLVDEAEDFFDEDDKVQ